MAYIRGGGSGNGFKNIFILRGVESYSVSLSEIKKEGYFKLSNNITGAPHTVTFDDGSTLTFEVDYVSRWILYITSNINRTIKTSNPSNWDEPLDTINLSANSRETIYPDWSIMVGRAKATPGQFYQDSPGFVIAF